MDTIAALQHADARAAAVDDWRGLGDLIEVATQRLTDPVEGIHRAVTDRWSALGQGDGSPGATEQSVIARYLFGSVRLAGSVARATLSTGAAAIGRHRPVRPLWASPAGAGIQAAANALWGDEFERRTSPMHTPMSIRDSSGISIASDAVSLTCAFPSPTRRLAVYLHGLGKTEHCWLDKQTETGDAVGIVSVLEADSFTPVLVRYNTGMRVSDNGAALASLLEDVTNNWPVGIDGIALIGHSMGGLVAQNSLHAGDSESHSWVKSVRHLVTLGTPHFGSPIEKGAHIASQVLRVTPESRPLSQFVDGRSAGIKDMRHGIAHDEGYSYRDRDPDTEHIVGVTPVHGVQRHHAASVVTDSTSHPFGFLVGDLVVRVDSATGTTLNKRVEATNVRVFGGLNHLAMLHDPAVHSQIREWLTPTHAGSLGLSS
jgi:pimeloyl-ACP methyl ester carboxylesterase